MSPILRKLSLRLLTPAEMADLLELHVGDGTNANRCEEAYEALRRMRKELPNFYMRAAFRDLDRGGERCACVRKFIGALRKWRYVSGA